MIFCCFAPGGLNRKKGISSSSQQEKNTNSHPHAPQSLQPSHISLSLSFSIFKLAQETLLSSQPLSAAPTKSTTSSSRRRNNTLCCCCCASLPWTTQLDHQVLLHSNSSLTISNSAT
ncbi:hypothetical protein CY35_05G132500 [Sphagnum magellanicum]|nr:hypothetical protein CY35_05G132500 [Sphagnum magellanicum]